MPLSAISPAGRNPLAPQAGTVQIITPAQFQQAVSKGRVVVEFFSYGCGFCRRAVQPVADAAQKLTADAKVLALSIDDAAGKRIGIQHGLSYYPTFAVFENGKHIGTFAREGNSDVTADFVV